MGFFKNLFSSSKSGSVNPDIQFGRFSDSYKDEVKYDCWDKALAHYEEEQYVQAYTSFFNYLLDDELGNVTFKQELGKLTFTLYQGSKLITGYADSRKFYAEAKVAKFEAEHIGVFRRLLEVNYQLKYSRYAIDNEQNLTIVFSTYSIDGSPYKLYYALKELATKADNADDVLISSYEGLSPINNTHIRTITHTEKQLKYQYLKSTIAEAEEALASSNLNISKHPGALSYLYLDLAYRIDYLLKPEGKTMDTVVLINHAFFKENGKTIEQKNGYIKNQFNKLKQRTFEKFERELYEVKSTFGVTAPSGQSRILDFIKSEIGNMDWYKANGHDTFALAIPSYIVGYCLYSYSMPSPMRLLLQLYYRVTEYPYFEQLGFKDSFVNKSSVLQANKIKEAIKIIVKTYEEDYDQLDPKLKAVDYTDIFSFTKSYLLMIADMNYSRKDLR